MASNLWPQQRYYIAVDRTCWVCSEGGTLKPRIHARRKPIGWEGMTPCMSVEERVWAHDRKDALRLAKKLFISKGGR